MNINMDFMPEGYVNIFFRLSPLLYRKLSFEFGRQENKNESTSLLIKVVIASNRWIWNISIQPTHKVTGFHNCLETSQISQIMPKTSLFFT